jgi:hypothetical protein
MPLPILRRHICSMVIHSTREGFHINQEGRPGPTIDADPALRHHWLLGQPPFVSI